LTRARALIEAHAGEITLASEVGKGTTATIALPVWKRDS
jgi:signal transduction histidine kinase